MCLEGDSEGEGWGKHWIKGMKMACRSAWANNSVIFSYFDSINKPPQKNHIEIRDALLSVNQKYVEIQVFLKSKRSSRNEWNVEELFFNAMMQSPLHFCLNMWISSERKQNSRYLLRTRYRCCFTDRESYCGEVTFHRENTELIFFCNIRMN
jgi:hypothetical protein